MPTETVTVHPIWPVPCGKRSSVVPPGQAALVWAKLRRNLALREMQDLQDRVVLTDAQYRQRAAQVLTT